MQRSRSYGGRMPVAGGGENGTDTEFPGEQGFLC